MKVRSTEILLGILQDLDEYVANYDDSPDDIINVDLTLIETNLITAAVVALQLIRGYERYDVRIGDILEKLGEAITSQKLGRSSTFIPNPLD